MTGGVDGSGDAAFIAFLSYRRDGSDDHWARRLQRELERFRVPQGLATVGRRRTRLGRVFLDESELPASSDLGATIHDALLRSQYLIVLCSPASAASRWVDAEIRAFAAARGHENVLAVLLDGTPATAFPPALIAGSGPDAQGVGPREPLAADLRVDKRGRRAPLRVAVVRLAAAVLGCGFDDLWQRDRRQRRQRAWTAVVGAGVVVGALLWAGLTERSRRLRLEFASERDLGRVDYLAARPADALVHLRRAAELDPSDATTVFLLARAKSELPAGMTRIESQAGKINQIYVLGDVVVTRAESALVPHRLDGSRVWDKPWNSDGLSRELAIGFTLKSRGQELQLECLDLVRASVSSQSIAAGYCSLVDFAKDSLLLLATRAGPAASAVYDVRRLADLQPTGRIEIPDATGKRAEFTPSGRQVVIETTHDGGTTVARYDVATGAHMGTFDFSGEEPGWVTLSPDESRAVVVGRKGRSTLVATATNEVIASWLGTDWGAEFSRAGTVVIVSEAREAIAGNTLRSAADGHLILEPTESLRELWFVDDHVIERIDTEVICRDLAGQETSRIARVAQLACRDDTGSYALLADHYGTTLVEPANLETGERFGSVQLQSAPTALARDRTGTFWVGGEDGKLTRIPATSPTTRRVVELPGHYWHVFRSFFLGVSSRIATIDLAGTVRIWDARGDMLTAMQAIPNNESGATEVRSVSRSSDGSVVALATMHDVYVLRLPPEGSTEIRAIRSIPATQILRHSEEDERIVTALDRTGTTLLASASFEGAATVFTGTGLEGERRVAIGRTCDYLALSSDARFALSSSAFDGAGVFALDSFAPLATAKEAKARCGAFTREVAAIGCSDGTLHLVGLEGRDQTILRLSPGPVLTLALDPTARQILAGTADGRIVAVDIGRRESVIEIDTLAVPERDDFYPVAREPLEVQGEAERTEFPRGVSALAVSPSGRWIASGANDATVAIWDATDGKLLCVRKAGKHGGVTSLDWSADSARLVASDSFESCWVFDLSVPASGAK